MNNEIGKRINDLRTKSGMTQKELAEKLCVTFQAVSKWEKGKTSPDIDSVALLSDTFCVSTDYLIKGKDFAEPRKSSSHWAVSKVNELISPLVLSDRQERMLISDIKGRDQDKEFIEGCICAACDTYVKSEDENERKDQVAEMLKKFPGVIYNRGLGPVHNKLRMMIGAISKRTGERDEKALRALKASTEKLLEFRCGKDSSVGDQLQTLDAINEEFYKPSATIWGCRNTIEHHLWDIKAQLSNLRMKLDLRKRIDEGLLPIDEWPSTVGDSIQEANNQLKTRDYLGFVDSLYKAVSTAVLLMIQNIPFGKRPKIEEGSELKDYVSSLHEWFGRRLGKNDAQYIALIVHAKCRVDRSALKEIINHPDSVASFMHRLFKKYTFLQTHGY